MGNALQDKTVLVIGRGSGIARAVALLAQSEGARVIVAGRDQAKLASAYGHPDISAEAVDITDDESIAALADRVGGVDHVVSTASACARGKLADLQRENLLQSFDTKVIGPNTTMCLACTDRSATCGAGWVNSRTSSILGFRWLCGIVVVMREVMPHLPTDVPSAGPRPHAVRNRPRQASSI
jgi:NAD(P)-dependent dehydrogenase (short-subunit alcohol dehydrogenase family)